jgi:putative FmdB family regulatory protein
MPTYEYRCPKGHEFELFQRMSDEPRADCPTCGEVSSRLLSAGAGFLFKGDGFYITDYRSDSYRAAAKKESGGAGESGGAKDSGGSKDAGSSAPASSPATKPAKSSGSSSSSSSD